MAKKAVRIFLDSNVILSGLFSEKGAPRIILDILCLGLPFVTGVTGEYNIVEVKRNLAKKIPDVLPIYDEYFPKLRLEVIPIPSREELKRFSGHVSDKDLPVLVSAVKGEVDFLVTGDKKDFSKAKAHGGYSFEIVSPSQFLDEIFQEMLKIKGLF